MGCGADTEAKTVLQSITGTLNFEIPTIDLSDDLFTIPSEGTDGIYAPIDRLTTADLTAGTIGGSGVFDELMKAHKAHLAEQFEKGRITGAEYTKAYIAVIEGAMSQGVAFLLGRDAAYWNAVAAQNQAKVTQVALATARVQMATAQVQLRIAQFEAKNQEAQYALTSMKLASESMAYCVAKYNLENVLPLEVAKLGIENQILTVQKSKLDQDVLLAEKQIAGAEIANQTATYNYSTILPKQAIALDKQNSNLDKQGILLDKQSVLTTEQTEVQRAQTMDTRLDGATPTAGQIGKQKALYAQQIISYQRDAETKAAKIFSDAWITMKTIDEGIVPPTNFNNASLDAILADIKTNNGLG